MDRQERDRAERGILADLAPALSAELAGHAWSRLLVQTDHSGGEPIAVAIDVEGVTDDDAVERAFAPDALAPLLPVLGKTIEALLLLRDVEPSGFGGGTLVWGPGGVGAGELVFVPGLVRTPSERLTADRDRVVAAAYERNQALRASTGLERPGAALAFDSRAQEITVRSEGEVVRRAGVLVATWEPSSWVFGWVGKSPEAPAELKRRAAALVDDVLVRDLWELSTPSFQTDPDTAFALAAFVADHARAGGVLALDESRAGVPVRGFVVVLPATAPR